MYITFPVVNRALNQCSACEKAQFSFIVNLHFLVFTMVSLKLASNYFFDMFVVLYKYSNAQLKKQIKLNKLLLFTL